ncbi:bardet-Biedl syndrome 12 [Nephila pilipes]|uniref:Bardet-Biedl syndrome 12 n=1 Tax=Nephila pilipes TaxID=299642 RepID=A0A8X6QGP3_NEPPI|nr:bardet-Biedl syndrome 12 [Nephila pilipes]
MDSMSDSTNFRNKAKKKVPPRFELGSLDSESRVLTITPWNLKLPMPGIEPGPPGLGINLCCFFSGFYVLTMSLKQLIGSIISSYLGPFKSNKFIVDGKDVYMVKCPVLLLQKMSLKDHLSYLIEDTLNSHHEKYGCSSISLLAMWYFWNEEFHIASQEGCDISCIVEHSQNILEYVISQLPKITIGCKEMFLKSHTLNDAHHLFQYYSFGPNRQTVSFSHEGFENVNNSNKIPIGIMYSSRHLSPSLLLHAEDEMTILEEKQIFEPENHKRQIKLEKLKTTMCSLVKKLSHDESDLTDLLSNVWIKQAESSNCAKFNIDGIILCPVTLPCSYSTVVDGLIIKCNNNYLYDQDLNFEKSRALAIKGSITFEYVHLGYSETVSISVKKTTEQLKISEKDVWIKKCCDLLLKLAVNVVLVNGEVDPTIISFCSVNSILILPDIPWNTLQDICVAVDKSPCTYLLDCDHDDVFSNLSVKKWNFDYTEMLDKNIYIHIDISNSKDINRLYTVILCHPNQFLLNNQEHQFWHLASRLHLATKENNLLPGAGKTEKWCFNLIQETSSKNSTEERIKSAVANGFFKYFQVISEKLKEQDKIYSEESLDEMQSKVQAWRSAMALTLVIMRCDCLIMYGCDDIKLQEFSLENNFVGFL